ncbi:MAG: alpha/beta hydrolase [Candidatus Thorarchaeota archaeon]
MTYEEGEYLGYDGTQMFMRIWTPDSKHKAIVLGLHGLGAHSGTISYVGEYFAKNGFLFYAPDMRGFGKFTGTKGHVDSFDEYVQDLDSLISYLKLSHPDDKFFMYGHSLGSLWAYQYTLTHSDGIDGLITPCPAVSERLKISAATRTIAKGLSKLNVKQYFDTGLDLDLIARNPEVVKRNKEDPLRFDKATPRFAMEGLGMREKIFNRAEDITLPIIVLQTGEDMILIPEENKKFFDRISSKDKTWKLYEGLYHEPFEDEGGEQVLADMISWVNERV